jgi:hypothetical protein
MKNHRNIKTLVETIFVCSTVVECCAKLDISQPTWNVATRELLGLGGNILEMRDAIIGVAKENPTSELANIIRIIDPSILPQIVEQVPIKYGECGWQLRVSRGAPISPNASGGLPFNAAQGYLRAKGRM